jgi:hypothetical protein
LTQEAAMLAGGMNPRSIRLREMDDKSIAGGLERERISPCQPSSAA